MNDRASDPAPCNRRLARWLRRALVVTLCAAALPPLAFHAAVAFWHDPAQVNQPPDATLISDTHGHPLAEFTAPDGQWRTTLREDQISPHLLNAIVAVEDARFFDHHGVDWRAATAAAWQDLTSLRAKRGASTLTMQLHRLRHPTAPHTLWGKFEQAVRAAQIEKRHDKREILVEYLNRAPFGGNLTGAGAASWRYFGRPCRDLTLAQSALLAGLPKNPTADRPDRFPSRAKARRDFVLDRMLALILITRDQHDQAVAEPLTATWRPLPQQTDPAARAALPTLTHLATQSAGGPIHTTLDLPTQQYATTAAQEHLQQQGESVGEIAVIVVDTATANCLASVSLSTSRAAADVDLTRRPRSTGSVIKPLIYAAAFDSGASSPQSLLDDSPAAWPGAYVPANYDHQFRGRITAADALAESRNIPALRLLSDVGVEQAAGVCAALGLQTLARTPQRYGLSLAVGGAEATPAEIAASYATLARGGVHRRLRWLTSPHDHDDVKSLPQCLSPRACRDTLAALSDPARTSAISPEAAALRAAWKTGTSSGHRDAWCAAVGPTRVVVVWMGNAGGHGARTLVGAEAAAPLALRILAAIDATAPPTTPPAPSPAPIPSRAIAQRDYLTIISPANRAEIVRDPDVPDASQRVRFQATASRAPHSTPTLSWFVDGSLIDTCAPGDCAWWQPTPGPHEIRVVDTAGHSDQVTIRVAAP